MSFSPDLASLSRHQWGYIPHVLRETSKALSLFPQIMQANPKLPYKPALTSTTFLNACIADTQKHHSFFQ